MWAESVNWLGGGHQTHEPVLLVRRAGEEMLRANLLYAPSRIFTASAANRTGPGWLDGAGVQMNKREILIDAGSGLPFFEESDLYPACGEETSFACLDGKRALRFSEGSYFHDRQVLIDYETEERWAGPSAGCAGDRLPAFRAALDGRKDVKIALLGDSISCGANASGFTGAVPHQPPFFRLYEHLLGELTGATATVVNFSKGGMTAGWGVGQVDQVIRAEADLVILAFGMNDASEKITVAEFTDHIRTMRDAVQSSPHTEVVVLSGMSPNPQWHLQEVPRRQEFHDSLWHLASERTVICDVRSVWDHMVSRKGFWSMTGNGINHPNDFGHRIYADCLLSSTLPARCLRKRNAR